MRNLFDLRKLLVVVFIMLMASCSKTEQEQVRPMENLAGARKGGTLLSPPLGGCPSGYVWDNTLAECVNPCSKVWSDNINSIARNRVVTVYPSGGGLRYDQLKNHTYNAPNVIYSFSTKAWSYTQQIRQAIVNGSNAYASAAGTTTAYNATTYLSYLNSYLTPLKNTINGDASLSSNEKTVLMKAFDGINENFTRTSNLVDANLNCYPTPTGLSSGTLAADATLDGPYANGMAPTRDAIGTVGTNSWLGNALKKVVNVIATVLVNVVEHAAVGAIWGGVVGSVGGPWGTIIGFGIGGLGGAMVGFFRGMDLAIQGRYVCVFGGVGSCA